MSASSTNAAREYQALRAQARREFGAGVLPPASADRALGLGLAIGTRVLDLVTGQEGVITDATVQHVIQPAPSGR